MIKLENSKIFVLGMARSGYEVSKYLSKYDNEIIVTDAKEQDEDKVKELEEKVKSGEIIVNYYEGFGKPKTSN